MTNFLLDSKTRSPHVWQRSESSMRMLVAPSHSGAGGVRDKRRTTGIVGSCGVCAPRLDVSLRHELDRTNRRPRQKNSLFIVGAEQKIKSKICFFEEFHFDFIRDSE